MNSFEIIIHTQAQKPRIKPGAVVCGVLVELQQDMEVGCTGTFHCSAGQELDWLNW